MPSDEPMPMTPESARVAFLAQLRALADYWIDSGIDPQGIVNGIVHSMLCMIDGVSAGIPGFDLVARTAPDHKEHCIENEDDWFVDGQVINGGVMLHDEWGELNKR